MNHNLSEYPDRLVETMKNKTIFVTGGTGFMGKVLIEKILRCTDVKKVYMLVRAKKGKQADERFKDIFGNPLFDQLKSLKPTEIYKKIAFVGGDASVLGLDISPDDQKNICENVEVIFHCAATIRFDEDLRPAVLLNVRGTREMLKLAKKCGKLVIFCHLSTAYCHLNERILYEKAYPPPADPESIIKVCESLTAPIINKISKEILGDFPNSYAYTKALAEDLVNNEMNNIPVVILRPSVVVPIWKGPIPGWTDNINGPTGLLIGAGKGVIRTMYCKGETYSDYVPVDIVVNCMLASVIDLLLYGERRIYNITSSAEYKISFEEIINIGRKVVSTKIPLNGVFWYPGGSMKSSKTLHYIAFYLFQWLPAVVVDAFLIILGYKPVLMNVQRRIWKGYEVFEYYANRQWDFNNDGSMEARKLLNPKEKMLYKLDGEGIDYEEYFTHCTYAARRYILKETDDMIPAAKRHMTVMWWADTVCKTLIIFGLIFLIWKLIFT